MYKNFKDWIYLYRNFILTEFKNEKLFLTKILCNRKNIRLYNSLHDLSICDLYRKSRFVTKFALIFINIYNINFYYFYFANILFNICFINLLYIFIYLKINYKKCQFKITLKMIIIFCYFLLLWCKTIFLFLISKN